MSRSRTLLITATLGVATMSGGTPGAAAVAAPASTAQVRGINAAALRNALQARAAAGAAPRSAATASKGAGGGTATSRPAEIYVNPNRAYPPSCMNDGLPFSGYGNDPNAQQTSIPLVKFDSATQSFDLTETDTFTVWRVPCSGGVSAVLVQIDRPSADNGDATQYLVFPDIYVAAAGSSTYSYPRLPQDPNTVYSDTPITSPLVYSSIYVLDYYDASQSSASAGFDYDQAFTLYVDNFSGGNPVPINVPAYSPASFNNYPSAGNPMPISGYMSTNWSNPDQSGEGMVVQVYDDGDQATRTLSFAWFTYDDQHLPFWLYGQGTFNIGDSSVTVPVVYFGGGSFAGTSAIPGNSPYTTWGSATIKFPDCNDMAVSYQGDASAVQGPTGNGTITFKRVASVNGLTCQ